MSIINIGVSAREMLDGMSRKQKQSGSLQLLLLHGPVGEGLVGGVTGRDVVTGRVVETGLSLVSLPGRTVVTGVGAEKYLLLTNVKIAICVETCGNDPGHFSRHKLFQS